MQNPVLAILALIQYFLFGTGLFLSTISEYFCFFHSKSLPPCHDKTTREVPDMELFWTAAYGSSEIPKLPRGKGAGSLMVQKSIPKSVGTVRLSSQGILDIKVDPIVDPGHLSDPDDWEVYRQGIVFARQLGQEMLKNGYLIEEAVMPKSNSNKDLNDHIRSFAISSQHYLSSCRMKPLEEGGVVDRELKVYGVNGLRIADGSVFPRMVASRPQASVVMVAERCADFILRDWKEKGEFI
jgi:choline dehydrogenase